MGLGLHFCLFLRGLCMHPEALNLKPFPEGAEGLRGLKGLKGGWGA